MFGSNRDPPLAQYTLVSCVLFLMMTVRVSRHPSRATAQQYNNLATNKSVASSIYTSASHHQRPQPARGKQGRTEGTRCGVGRREERGECINMF